MFRDFVCLQVCEQCADSIEGNTVGTRSGRSRPVLPLLDRVRSQGVRIEHRSRTRNAVQRRTCAAFQRSRSNGVNQLPPIRLGASAREHDFSEYWQTVGCANRLKKKLYRHNSFPDSGASMGTDLPEPNLETCICLLTSTGFYAQADRRTIAKFCALVSGLFSERSSKAKCNSEAIVLGELL